MLCGAALLVATLAVSIADGGFSPLVFFAVFGGTSFWISLAGAPAAAFLMRFDGLGYGAAAAMVLVYSAFGAALVGWEILAFLVPSSAAFFVGLTVAVQRRQREKNRLSSLPSAPKDWLYG
jgi:hypothetical protein